jgi:hypothetical protein
MLLGAIEVELTGGLNFMTYHPDREIPHNTGGNQYKFQEYNYGYGDLSVKGEISGNLGYNVQLSRDNILKNTLSASVFASNDYLSVHFGPYFGITDDFEEGKMEVGISGGVQLALPGIVFLALNGTSTLGLNNLEFLGENSREVVEVKLGFWLPSLIPSVSYSLKSYSGYKNGALIRDELERFLISADFFFKDFPLTFRVDAGLEYLRRVYDSYNVTDVLGAYFVGGEVKWKISLPIQVIAGFEVPIMFDEITKAQQNMIYPENGFILFKFHAGIALKFF